MRLFLLLFVVFSFSFLSSYQGFAQEQSNGGREHSSSSESSTSAQSEGECHSIDDIELGTATAALSDRPSNGQNGQGVE